MIAHMRGVSRLIARMLYGSGLRIGEGIALRVKDVDVAERIITVRGGKGDKDRMTVLAESMVAPLMEQLNAVRALHARDLASRRVVVPLPNVLGRKFPGAASDLGSCGPRKSTHAIAGVRPWRKFVVGRELVQSEQRANRAGRVRNMQLTRKKLCCK